ncbi:hypothetical protein V5P93_003740 [Actinokineospora auranticolor]|uniref:Uncharacterized protein n=1 Tax=Actinokineospora auranticolor TaxID=155976 RepID=A0A2S6GJ90_9PSEU|nr:hypothetical protein [Actinokineospora auranticolor]PPK65302.1 hypothetical protein CLV40_115149 [Actinokineospora auranticolor]
MATPDVEHLLHRLWPDAEITLKPVGPRMTLTWNVELDDSRWFDGSLSTSGICLSAARNHPHLARLAFHAKRELAPEQPLTLFDESLDFALPLEGLTEEEILAALAGD